MLTRTQPLPSRQCSAWIVDCDTEDIGPQHARHPTPLRAEIDIIREATRLA